jgi:hypothetical protein
MFLTEKMRRCMEYAGNACLIQRQAAKTPARAANGQEGAKTANFVCRGVALD